MSSMGGVIITSIEQQWGRVCGRLREEVGEGAFKSWLRPVVLVDLEGGEARIAAPTKFMRDWVAAHYADRIRKLWHAENPDVQSVDVIVVPDRLAARPAAAPPAPAATAPTTRTESAMPDRPPESATDFGAILDQRFTFDNFVVGKPNELAHAAARRVAEANSVTFNPLFLYGGVGLGKTHLMHGIAWHIRQKHPERRVLYMSAEKFMYQFIRALRFKDTMTFKELFRSVDVLMIDDVQFISGKDSTQEEFFHTFNALVDQNRQVVISADKSPSDLEGMEERLRSRLGWGLVADIHPTTYELRLGILQAKAETARVEIPAKVMEFLAHKITSNVRELEGALNRITAHAELVHRPVTLESTQELLHDLLRASDRRVTIDEIQKRVAEHYNIKIADMHSARRARTVARPRQVAMYLSKQLTPRSLPEIGRKFGGRDHTTVMHAVKKVEELCSEDRSFAEDVELLRRMLQI
ncbi:MULTISPECIES: chromosomal replication initiator protein DnaA [unclassified Inquilinus]|uniref:chromosomal replication initiator protein DnaA n=1 Tax=unclassified Inquilinus TaxID=2645927 RepID=UPI003F91F2E9